MKGVILNGIALTFLLASSSAIAKVEDKARIKCHIALLGGAEIIHYKIMPAHQGVNYFDKLKKSKRITNKRNSERIFDVFECVSFGKDFTNPKANELESSLPK